MSTHLFFCSTNIEVQAEKDYDTAHFTMEETLKEIVSEENYCGNSLILDNTETNVSCKCCS